MDQPTMTKCLRRYKSIPCFCGAGSMESIRCVPNNGKYKVCTLTPYRVSPLSKYKVLL